MSSQALEIFQVFSDPYLEDTHTYAAEHSVQLDGIVLLWESSLFDSRWTELKRWTVGGKFNGVSEHWTPDMKSNIVPTEKRNLCFFFPFGEASKVFFLSEIKVNISLQ